VDVGASGESSGGGGHGERAGEAPHGQASGAPRDAGRAAEAARVAPAAGASERKERGLEVGFVNETDDK
jgi:hypothetical protein